MGEVKRRIGEPLQAAAHYLDQAETLYRELGNRGGRAHVTMARGRMAHEAHDHNRALDAFHQGRAVFQDLGEVDSEVEALRLAAAVEQTRGREGHAAMLRAQAERLVREEGVAGQAFHEAALHSPPPAGGVHACTVNR